MTKRIVVHAGPGKTGTSAIQHWLTNHVDELARDGVLYPKHGTDTNRVSSGNLFSVFTRGDDGKLAIDRWKVAKLNARFRASRHHTLLLSSEFFALHLNELNQRLPNAEFVAYVRDPIERAESNYNQGVKRKRIVAPFRIGMARRTPFLDRLTKVLDVQDPPSIQLRPYLPGQFRGGTIVTDLLYAIGLRASNYGDVAGTTGEMVNSSYSLEALEFKRVVNRYRLGEFEPELDRVLQAFSDGTQDYSFIPTKQYEALRRDVLIKVDAFLECFDHPELQPFRDHVATKVAPRHVRQQATQEQIQRVSDYIRSQSPVVFEGLANLARGSTDEELP